MERGLRQSVALLNYDFPAGYPSGKIGLVSSVANVEFDTLRVSADAAWLDLGPG